jgi:hypothetical protein
VTARVHSVGSVVAAVIFVAAFALSIAGTSPASVMVATLGVVVLLGTPALGLLSSAIELRSYQPRVAGLAVVVLLILVAAALISFATSV